MLQETYLIFLANIQFFPSDVMDVTVNMVKTIFMISVIPVIPTGSFQSEAIVPLFFPGIFVADSLLLTHWA